MKIAILTYTCKHKKTYDTICLLKAKGYKNVTVYAQPMTYTKKFFPVVKHRPEMNVNIPNIKDICKNFEYQYIEGDYEENVDEIPEGIIFLLCGAGILPQSFISKYKIINSHPGYIPDVRGLDSYKWALYYHLPIGVTTHLLGKYVDGGEIIERRKIKIESYDTFHSVAQRIYDNEIDMLVNAIDLINLEHEFIVPDGEPFRRMPKEMEKRLIELYKIGFDKYYIGESVREVCSDKTEIIKN